MLEMEAIFAGKKMRMDTAPDGKKFFSMFEFANIVNGKVITDKYGSTTVQRVLDNPNHKSALEKYGIYDIRTERGSFAPAMTFLGLKELLSKLPGEFADNYRAYCIEITTRVEAGDASMHNVIDTNAVSSNILNQMARDALPHLAASGGASIAAPPEQVLERACLLLLHLR
jgi:hypothetical protein